MPGLLFCALACLKIHPVASDFGGVKLEFFRDLHDKRAPRLESSANNHAVQPLQVGNGGDHPRPYVVLEKIETCLIV